MEEVAEQDSTGVSDGELLRHFVCARRESAFAAIVERHGAMVFSVCRAVLADSHDAEDAAQAVFLTLAQKAKALAGHATLAGWLHRVAWYTAARARQARLIRRQKEKAFSGMQTTPSPVRDDSIPPEALHAALAELPEKYRVPLLLHYLEERTEAETAALLGIGTSAASMRLSRGREKLRHRLARRNISVPAAGLAMALGGLRGPGMPGNFAAATTHAAVSIITGHAASAAMSASAMALSKGALSMLIRAKLKTVAIVAAIAILAAGAVATTYTLTSSGRAKSSPLNLTGTPTTQKDSDAATASARQKLATIRKKIEDAGHAHNVKDNAATVDIGFEYLASHLHDPAVAKFDPLSGFSDYTVSPGDNGQIVLLIERTDKHNGLNLTVDTVTASVVNAHYWGN